jgi:hypothetical protein
MYGSIKTIPFGKRSDYGMRATVLKDGLKVNSNETARQFTSAAKKDTFIANK